MGKLGKARSVTLDNEEFLAIPAKELGRLNEFFKKQNEQLGARGEKSVATYAVIGAALRYPKVLTDPVSGRHEKLYIG